MRRLLSGPGEPSISAGTTAEEQIVEKAGQLSDDESCA